jgi:uncharacterized protein (TIGR02646 family)
MWKIIKTREPRTLTEYKKTLNATYENMHSNIKEEVRLQLLKDQGFLCCYCMCRLKAEKTKIEHFQSQKKYPTLDLDYKNLFIACTGNEGQIFKNQTCDTKKSDLEIKNFNLITTDFSKQIQYNIDGHIKSSNPSIDTELNEILNLNNQILKENRKNVYLAINNNFKKLHNKEKFNLYCLNKLRNKYLNKNNKDEFESFFPIAIYFIEKKLKKGMFTNVS